MKNFHFLAIFILGLIFTFPLHSLSQGRQIELTPFVGYQFGGTVKFYEGKIKIDNGMNYGLAASVDIRYGVKAEFYYSRVATRGKWTPYLGFENTYPPLDFDLAINYFQIGSVKEFLQDDFRPFGAFTLGAVWFDPKDVVSDQWFFSITLGGGIKYYFTDRVGIRLQGRLLLPMVFSGVGLYAGIGTGGVSTGAGFSSWAPVVQGDLTGGLIIVLGK
jgi:hypothetical protein